MKIQNLCRNLRQRIMPSFCFVPLWERIRSGADCRLAEQIHDRFKILAGFDLGTQVTLLDKAKFVLLANALYSRVPRKLMYTDDA
jgi:hypothetical protein